MNGYYSNLIEGHDTHPIEIERALNNDYSGDTKKRELQLEAKAHIETQQWIDEGGLPKRPLSEAAILGLHRYFCERLPEELLWVENPDSGERIKVIPGQYRHRDVIVGRHVPISPGALPRFMTRFEEAYLHAGKVDMIIAAATAHHRLLWQHPFSDGNGRVARLMSHAILREALETGGAWSVARGLARNVNSYKAHLAACDEPRQGDTDGRGNLSETRLAMFSEFFLETCIDQVRFMEEIIQPERLRQRIKLWAEEATRLGELPPRSDSVLDALLYRGELPRAEIPALLGSGDRHARRITSSLAKAGVITSTSSRAPFHLAFPAKLAGRWMPGLFPEK
jgi:Fic family protein